MSTTRPIIALTQGDPAGIGPEIVLRVVAEADRHDVSLLLFVERAAIESLRGVIDAPVLESIRFQDSTPDRAAWAELDGGPIAVDPVGDRRQVDPGHPARADAAGAVASIDAAVAAVRSGAADAIVTAPVSKASIARHHLPSFRGHTEYLAEGAGLERYGRDYLMAFLAPDLQVALLSTHLPLADAVAGVTAEGIAAAAACLARHAGGRIAVPGVNPHAGESGLLGSEDEEIVLPAPESSSRVSAVSTPTGRRAPTPSSPARARGPSTWVLALYHDQGLIAVKTAAFGTSTNWTLGLPYLRTSVDHGTAFDIAGRGIADPRPLTACLDTTARILAGELPRRAASPFP